MVQPYNQSNSKKSEVRAMFNNIARSYDFLNHFLSLGIDISWRKKVIRELLKYQPQRVLDMATGTGDLAIMAVKKGIKQVVGIDLSDQMIAVGQQKIEQRELNTSIQMMVGDAEKIDFGNDHFDAAMVAFGVRNFEDLPKGLSEIARVLKSDQPLLVLEFSKPVAFPVKQFYYFYSFHLLPFIGKMISKDDRAYRYLPESIRAFPSGDDFLEIMRRRGFKNTRRISLSFGIASIYIGEKE